MNSEQKTSFYKFLCDHDFTSQLRLPPQFVKNHGTNMCEKAKLLDESGHCSWPVKIAQIGNHHFFTDGWMKFARDADLKFQEFLLFKFVGNSTFEVSVYAITGCQKELRCRPRNHGEPNHKIRCTDHIPRTRSFGVKTESEYDLSTDQTADGEIRRFAKKLTVDHTSELDIPRGFAVERGILRNRKLKLWDAKGKKWPIYVTAKKCGKIVVTAGWNEFLTGNNVVVGSTISFEFVGSSRDIIKARVVEKGSGGELFSSAKKGRGRPPKLQD